MGHTSSAVEVTGTGGIVHLPSGEHLFSAARSGLLLQVRFASREDRLASGEKPCRYCGALAWDPVRDELPDLPLTHGPYLKQFSSCLLCRVGALDLEREAARLPYADAWGCEHARAAWEHCPDCAGVVGADGRLWPLRLNPDPSGTYRLIHPGVPDGAI